MKLVKRKQNYDNAYAASGWFTPEYNQGFQKAVDEDTSNRSSSGSAISNSESCVQFGGTDASDLTGWTIAVCWFHWNLFLHNRSWQHCPFSWNNRSWWHPDLFEHKNKTGTKLKRKFVKLQMNIKGLCFPKGRQVILASKF